ncbi:MAG: AAA family ATPase [Fimbriiglobus sp.]|jgi:hypothetical protein|nr:AAA family ATPase [Fimbriiglobus sp.]
MAKANTTGVKGKLIPASKARPCPVCQGDHKCSTTADGLILCGRNDGPVVGFRHFGASADPTWHLYRSEEEYHPDWGTRIVHPNPPAPPPHALTPDDWKATARGFARKLKDDHRNQLADKLKLPRPALHLIPYLGWNPDQGGWTWAECNAAGEVIGVGVRLVDGSKRCVIGSRRGLFLPNGWADSPGPVFVVEGMSDAVALGWVGLSSVGRPGAKAGTDLLAALLAPLPPDRPLVVLGENDRKADGSWPGKDGADFTAARLRAMLPGRTVLVAAPPDGCKDARDWVTLRIGAVMSERPLPETDPNDAEAMAYAQAQAEDAAAKQVGQDIAAQISRMAKQAPAPPAVGKKGTPPLAPFPVPMPVTELARGTTAGVPWVWDGYLARGRVTLFSALPKCGKTTLLSHLLKSLDAGGSFCGRTLMPGSAVVVTEESADEWAQRAEALRLTARVRVLPRPFFGKPSYEDWLSFLTHLLAHLEADPADLVVLDTLADLWPAKDENSATDVHAALQPLRKLAEGRAVCVVHHLRKSDGQEGTGTRGSGALVGFVDVAMELRRAAKSTDPNGRRRVLKGYGRMSGIPDEWLIELAEDGSGYTHIDADAAAATEARERAEEERKETLRGAITGVLARVAPKSLTREELWDELPPDMRKNEKRFRTVLEEGAGTLWQRDGKGRNGGAFRYWWEATVTHPGEEGGEG